MDDLITRNVVIDGIKELFSYGDCYCDKQSIIGFINSLPSAQPESQLSEKCTTFEKWIPVSEIPSDNREVEVTCEVRRLDGKKYRYTCHASYVHRYSIESTDYCDWEENDEYNEEDDTYYALPGWYEIIHNWGEYSHCAIEDFVMAWRELSKPYQEEGGM